MNPIIETKDLTHIYSQGTPFEHYALKHVNFSVMPGEFMGIIGHTGSGKSTLIQHLNGLLKPSSGTVLFDGEDIWKGQAVYPSGALSGGTGIPVSGVPAV